MESWELENLQIGCMYYSELCELACHFLVVTKNVQSIPGFGRFL